MPLRESIFRPILERLEHDLATQADVPAVAISVNHFEERPFSYILQIETRSPAGAGLFHAYVKVFKAKPLDGGAEKMRQRVAHEFEVTSRVFAALCGHPRFGAVRPLACYPEHLAIVTETVTGSTLLQYLRGAATWFPSMEQLDELGATMVTVGEWIRQFQAVEPPSGATSLAELRDYVDLRLKGLVRQPLATFTDRDRGRVLKHMEQLSAEVDSSMLLDVPVHADLAPGNVIINGKRVVVLDFAMARVGNALQDVSRLLLQIELLLAKPIFRKAVIDRLMADLLSGFDRHLTLESPMIRLMLLRHRINHFATLCSNGGSLTTRVYQARLRRRHRSWIENELRSREHASVR